MKRASGSGAKVSGICGVVFVNGGLVRELLWPVQGSCKSRVAEERGKEFAGLPFPLFKKKKLIFLDRSKPINHRFCPILDRFCGFLSNSLTLRFLG